jgi:probable phosphoglycerate mutase
MDERVGAGGASGATSAAGEAMDERVGAGGASGSASAAGGAFAADVLRAAVDLAQRQPSGAQRHPGVPGPITTVILVRHGMSVMTDRDVFAGAEVPGPPLSAAGEAQAEAAAAELRRMLATPWFGLERPDALLTSPTARAAQTAEAFGRAFGLEIRVDAGFVEQDFGLWDGLTKAEVDVRWPGGVDSWSLDAAYTPEGGESREALGRRVRAAVDSLVGEHRGRTVVVATHAMAARAAIGVALGAPPDAWFSFRVAPASLNILRFWDRGHTEVVCVNRTA